MEPEVQAPALVARFLAEARRRRALAAWLRASARAAAWLAALALAGLLAAERYGPRRSLAFHAGAAAAVVAVAAAVGAGSALRRRGPVARRVDAALGTGALVETASEWSPGRTAPLVARLCLRAAAERLAGRDPRALFPIPLPNFRLPSLLVAAIVLSAWLPRLGAFGSDASGFGERPVAPERGGTAVAGARPRPEGGGAAPSKEESQENGRGAPSRPASAPKDRDQDSGAESRRPDPPPPIPPFQALPKVVPIDPRSGWRAKREALVVEVTEGPGEGRASAAAPPEPVPAPLDAARIRALERAAEAALAKDAIAPAERAFAKRFYEQLLPR